jgi:uncharacterized membrane protein
MITLYERVPRTLFKILSWRIVMNISQFLGGWLVSGDLSIAFKIFGWSILINTICYYLHERAWNKVNLGRQPNETTKIYEKKSRTLGKICTWRVSMTMSQFLIGYISSGNPWIGIGMIGYSAIVNSLIFYIHERLWNKTSIGKEVIEQ